MDAVRAEVQQNNAKANASAKPNFAYGYGGKYGVQEDRQDKVGGVPGLLLCAPVPMNRQRAGRIRGVGSLRSIVLVPSHIALQVAVGHDYQAPASKHSSQVDQKQGFGGEFGLQDTQDKSALGYDADTKVSAHASTASKTAESSGSAAGTKAKYEALQREKEEAERKATEERQAARAAADQA